MCLLCVEIIKGNLTAEEAKRNLAEMSVVLEPDHIELIEELIADQAHPLVDNT